MHRVGGAAWGFLGWWLASAGGTFLGCPTYGNPPRKVPGTFLGCPTYGNPPRKVPGTFLGRPTCGSLSRKVPIEVGLSRGPGNPGYV